MPKRKAPPTAWKPGDLAALMKEAQELCASHEFSLFLNWSEAEHLWYAWADGQGQGENVEVKKKGSAERALEDLIERLRDLKLDD